MSILKPKTSEGKLPVDAFMSFNGQNPGSIRLEIKGADGNTTKYTPTAVRYLVIDEDFKEVGGIRMGASQDEGVRSNVCYGWDQNYFKVRLKNGTNVAAGPWGTIKSKCELYKGRLENFSFVVLLKVGGTTDDAKINQLLAAGNTVSKVSYHGQTSYAYGTAQKKMGANDFAGHVIQVKSFMKVKSEKTGLESSVPVFEVTKADENSKEYTNSVAIFLDRIEPYIKYVKGGGTMAEVEEQQTPEAPETAFNTPDSDDWIPSMPPPEREGDVPPTDDLLF
jgi:hypothetical protein